MSLWVWNNFFFGYHHTDTRIAGGSEAPGQHECTLRSDLEKLVGKKISSLCAVQWDAKKTCSYSISWIIWVTTTTGLIRGGKLTLMPTPFYTWPHATVLSHRQESFQSVQPQEPAIPQAHPIWWHLVWWHLCTPSSAGTDFPPFSPLSPHLPSLFSRCLGLLTLFRSQNKLSQFLSASHKLRKIHLTADVKWDEVF